MDEEVRQARAPRRVSVVALVLVTVASATLAAVGTAVALDGFTDVAPGSTHEAGISWLVDNQITSGCAEGRYCPNDPVTRAQMGTFMHRLSGNADGVGPSVDAATLEGRTAEQLRRPSAAATVNGFADPPVVEAGSTGIPAVSRFSAGTYCVLLEDPGLAGGAVSVTPFGGSATIPVMVNVATCFVGGQAGVQVALRDAQGVARDRQFSIIVP
jgi:hypothetical protein